MKRNEKDKKQTFHPKLYKDFGHSTLHLLPNVSFSRYHNKYAQIQFGGQFSAKLHGRTHGSRE